MEADLLRWPNAWPKSIWVDMYEIWGKRDRNNVHVVSYRRVNQVYSFFYLSFPPTSFFIAFLISLVSLFFSLVFLVSLLSLVFYPSRYI